MAGEDEQGRWCATAARGWSEFVEVADQIAELGRVSFNIPGAVCFLAELDGEAIGTGTLHTSDGVALLAGASTVPEARKQGAQLALLEARLRRGAGAGCNLAMMGAAPGVPRSGTRSDTGSASRIRGSSGGWDRNEPEA